MQRYRAHIFGEHGDLTGSVDFDCADDEEAKERARQLDGDDVELWLQIRLLDRDGQSDNEGQPKPQSYK